MSPRKNLTLLSLLFAATLTAQADPDFLITINETNPSNVIFSATGNAPLVSDSSHFFGEGIDITQFFTADIGSQTLTGSASNLMPVNGSSTYFYNGALSDNLVTAANPSGAYLDINPYNVGDANAGENNEPPTQGVTPEIFSTSSPALSGAIGINLSAYALYLPSLGATGDIYAGYGGENFTSPPGATPVIIGQWEVLTVPEPSVFGFLVLGGLMLAGTFLVRTRKVS